VYSKCVAAAARCIIEVNGKYLFCIARKDDAELLAASGGLIF
jgi:hypothetical protein